jgi:hypothetical protein
VLAGWLAERLVKVQNDNTMGAAGWCLEPHDLAVSKLAAGREKDLAFVQAMVRRQLVSPKVIRERLAGTPRLLADRLEVANALLDQWAA